MCEDNLRAGSIPSQEWGTFILLSKGEYEILPFGPLPYTFIGLKNRVKLNVYFFSALCFLVVHYEFGYVISNTNPE